MAKQINLGKVVGSDAKINGVNTLNITAENGVEAVQQGDTLKLSAPGVATHTGKRDNPHGVTKAQVGLPNTVDGATKVEASSNNGKIKINGTETTVYTHPSDTAAAAAFIKVGKDDKGHVVVGGAVTKGDITGLGIPAQDTTYSAATQSANGLMTAADKKKLDEIDAKANKYTHPTAHEATMITEDATHRFVTDSDKSTWNGKQNKLTGRPDQYVGFDEAGNAVAKVLDYSLFGFELNLDESNPSSKVRYLEGNANYQSAKMNFTDDVFDPGDWGNAWFMKDISPVVLQADGTVKYELNKNDYSKKIDGTDIDVTDAGTDNVMIGIPTVWVKVDASVPRKPKFYFSSVKFDASFHAYAHTDAAGHIMPYTYMPAYNGSKDSNNRLRSVSGKDPCRNVTGQAQIEAARKNNTGGATIWDMEVLSDRMLITLLLTLIGKSTNTQAVFGNGNMSGYSNKTGMPEGMHDATNGVLYSGTMDQKGLFWGSNADPANKGVKVFGIENFWGNVWRRTQGLVNDNGTIKAKLTRGAYDGSTATDYNTTGAGYIEVGACPAASGSYISDMFVGDFGLLPKAVSGASDTTHFCDAMWSNNGQNNFALFGGASNNGSCCGAFACGLVITVSSSYWYIGAGVSCKPLA